MDTHNAMLRHTELLYKYTADYMRGFPIFYKHKVKLTRRIVLVVLLPFFPFLSNIVLPQWKGECCTCLIPPAFMHDHT